MGTMTTDKSVRSEARSVALVIRGHNAVETGFIDERIKGMNWSLKVSHGDAAKAILAELEAIDGVDPKLVETFRSTYSVRG